QPLDLKQDLVGLDTCLQPVAASIEQLRLNHAPLGVAGAPELVGPAGIGERSLETRHHIGLEPGGKLQVVIELLIQDEERSFDSYSARCRLRVGTLDFRSRLGDSALIAIADGQRDRDAADDGEIVAELETPNACRDFPARTSARLGEAKLRFSEPLLGQKPRPLRVRIEARQQRFERLERRERPKITAYRREI